MTEQRHDWFVNPAWAIHVGMYGDLEDRTLLLMIVQHMSKLEGYMTDFRSELEGLESAISEKLGALTNRIASVIKVIRELPTGADNVTQHDLDKLHGWAAELEADNSSLQDVLNQPATTDPTPAGDAGDGSEDLGADRGEGDDGQGEQADGERVQESYGL